ncbi:hypothetical protein ACTXGU_01570 [Niallia sp. 01092]|uniref:hypothetical protein n=1 Tax=Niallia sp. 01092 TaxID=3457759 RepID=UPI003FD5E8B6
MNKSINMKVQCGALFIASIRKKTPIKLVSFLLFFTIEGWQPILIMNIIRILLILVVIIKWFE